MFRFRNTEEKFLRATSIVTNKLVFVTNPHNYPVRDGDVVTIDMSQRDLPITCSCNHSFCTEVILMIHNEKEYSERYIPDFNKMSVDF